MILQLWSCARAPPPHTRATASKAAWWPNRVRFAQSEGAFELCRNGAVNRSSHCSPESASPTAPLLRRVPFYSFSEPVFLKPTCAAKRRAGHLRHRPLDAHLYTADRENERIFANVVKETALPGDTWQGGLPWVRNTVSRVVISGRPSGQDRSRCGIRPLSTSPAQSHQPQ